MLRALLVSLVVLGLAASCQRPSPEQCQEMCWKYNELSFWEKFESEAINLGPSAKAEARAEQQKLWDEIKGREFDPGLRNCITACKDGGERKQASCMEKAETAAAARACFK